MAALQDLGAADIAIVSPYDDRLTQASGDYWASRGLRVRQVVRVEARSVHGAEPHPIYGLNSEAATDALGRVDAAGCDAIVMLGTGMPTLGAVRQAARLQGKPVLSSMLALVWDALRDGHAGQACSAADWIDRGHWHAAYDAQRMPAAALPA